MVKAIRANECTTLRTVSSTDLVLREEPLSLSVRMVTFIMVLSVMI